LLVWAWRDGSLVVPEPLNVITWSLQDDAGDSVKVGQRLSLTVADPEGTLGAWRFEDPLSVAGTKVQVIYRIGGAGAVNLGWFRVTGNEPDEVTDSRVLDEYGYAEPGSADGPHRRRVYVTSGVVKLEAVDLTYGVDKDRFESPQSPAPGATVMTEFARLTANHFPTVVEPGVPDREISGKTVWDRERLEACQDILALVGARYRMGGDGECRIYPRLSAPVWRVEPTAGLVSVARKQTMDGLYNRWVVEGKDAGDGAPVRAVASIESGPLRYGGPHGRVPFFYQSEMIVTTEQATSHATRLRDEFLGSLAVELAVETVPRPELQAGDWVEVGCPFNGHLAYIRGQIQSIRRSGSTVPSGTSLTVACSYADVTQAMGRTDWAQHITEGMPELTWERMPGNWGNLPEILWNDLP
jgi:hypothetical protein